MTSSAYNAYPSDPDMGPAGEDWANNAAPPRSGGIADIPYQALPVDGQFGAVAPEVQPTEPLAVEHPDLGTDNQPSPVLAEDHQLMFPVAVVSMRMMAYAVAGLRAGVKHQDELEARVAELRDKNSHDQLTGLLSKEAFQAELAKRIEQGEASIVCKLDFDLFKLVNDRLGHETGDDLLARWGQFAQENFRRKDDFVSRFDKANDTEDELAPVGGRLGGDEFGMILSIEPSDQRGDNIAENVEKTAAYVRKKLDQFVSEQPEAIQELGFNISVGMAVLHPNNSTDARTVMEDADAAMYAAKIERKVANLSEEQRAGYLAVQQIVEQNGLSLRDMTAIIEAISTGH